MPIGILGSLAIRTVIYIFVAVVLIGIVPYQHERPIRCGGIDATGITWPSPVIKIAALFVCSVPRRCSCSADAFSIR